MTNPATMNDTNQLRGAVAKWAQYCMGSCHGDWAPETEAIYDEVMSNDSTYEFYRRSMEKSAVMRRRNEPAGARAVNVTRKIFSYRPF